MLPKVTMKAKAARHRHRMILERRMVMAKTPRSDSPEDHNVGAENGEIRNSVVCLAGGAGRYADKHQIRDELVALDLGPDCRPGDIVSRETRERPQGFGV